jgi:hypothetical protein
MWSAPGKMPLEGRPCTPVVPVFPCFWIPVVRGGRFSDPKFASAGEAAVRQLFRNKECGKKGISRKAQKALDFCSYPINKQAWKKGPVIPATGGPAKCA